MKRFFVTIIICEFLVVQFACIGEQHYKKYDNANDYESAIVLGSKICVGGPECYVIKTIRATTGEIIDIKLPIQYEDIFMEGDTIQ